MQGPDSALEVTTAMCFPELNRQEKVGEVVGIEYPGQKVSLLHMLPFWVL